MNVLTRTYFLTCLACCLPALLLADGNGRSAGGLAYSSTIPAGVGGAGVLRTGLLSIDATRNLSALPRSMWVECDPDAAQHLLVKVVEGTSSGVGAAQALAESVRLEEIHGDDTSRDLDVTSRRRYWVHFEGALAQTERKGLEFHLRGGTLFAFGIGSIVRGQAVKQVQSCRIKSDDSTTIPCRLYPLRDDPFANPASQRNWVQPPISLHNRTIGVVQGVGGWNPSNQIRDALNASGLGSGWKPTFAMFDINETVLNSSLYNMMSRDQYLVDLWDYIPGDDDDCKDERTREGNCEYHLKRKILDLADTALGDRYCGMENGEQDGRYQTAFNGELLSAKGGGAASSSAELRKSYLHFMDFSDRIADDLGNKLISVNSLFSTHYFAHAGFHTMLGQETAEALPSPQVAYAFHRGASKQYGQAIWGIVSVFARGRSYKKVRKTPF
jgi:hypothetical protein